MTLPFRSCHREKGVGMRHCFFIPGCIGLAGRNAWSCRREPVAWDPLGRRTPRGFSISPDFLGNIPPVDLSWAVWPIHNSRGPCFSPLSLALYVPVSHGFGPAGHTTIHWPRRFARGIPPSPGPPDPPILMKQLASFYRMVNQDTYYPNKYQAPVCI